MIPKLGSVVMVPFLVVDIDPQQQLVVLEGMRDLVAASKTWFEGGDKTVITMPGVRANIHRPE